MFWIYYFDIKAQKVRSDGGIVKWQFGLRNPFAYVVFNKINV